MSMVIHRDPTMNFTVRPLQLWKLYFHFHIGTKLIDIDIQELNQIPKAPVTENKETHET